jgi:hypothetical protein
MRTWRVGCDRPRRHGPTDAPTRAVRVRGPTIGEVGVTPFHSSRARHARRTGWLRRGLILTVALVLLAGAVAAARLAAGPGHANVSNHPVTMRRDQGLADCSGNPEAWSGFDYGGVPWQPMGSFPPSWGSRGPWAGVLTITGRAPDPQGSTGRVVITGLFDYRGTQVPVFGGEDTRPTPLC